MRGFDYYKSGNIISLEYENHEWVAEVEGSYDYTVTAKLTDSDDITNTYCNCPYDMGVYCKHQVAVFYALKKDNQRNKTEKKPDNTKFDEVINKLDKQTLIKIILDITNGNSRIKYERVEQLCLEGERSCTDRGFVHAFKEYRYNLYEKTMDIAKQTTLAIELLLIGKKNYYHKLKELCNEHEWQEILNNILNVLSEKDPGKIYLDIVLNENLKSRLMDYCNGNIYLIKTYYPKLLPEYSAEIGEMFVVQIFDSEKRASSRSGYRNVCDWIRHYKKVSGNVAADAIKKELLLRNARRPAFVDELNKL